MNLYINGCSFSFGSVPTFDHDHNGNTVISKPFPEVYQYHLEPYFGKTVNQSIAGASNDRIVRKTLDFFSNRYDHSNWLAVIQWTSPYREEVYPDRFGSYCGTIMTSSASTQILGYDHNTTYRLFSYKNDSEVNYSVDHARFYSDNMLHNRSEEIVANKLFQNMLLLQEYFRNKKIPAIFLSMNDDCFPFRMKTDPAQSSGIRKNMLDQSLWIDKSMQSITGIDIIGTTASGIVDNHPNEHAHKRVADRILKQMNIMGLVNLD